MVLLFTKIDIGTPLKAVISEICIRNEILKHKSPISKLAPIVGKPMLTAQNCETPQNHDLELVIETLQRAHG